MPLSISQPMLPEGERNSVLVAPCGNTVEVVVVLGAVELTVDEDADVLVPRCGSGEVDEVVGIDPVEQAPSRAAPATVMSTTTHRLRQPRTPVMSAA